MKRSLSAVYDPPRAGLPYLSVTMAADGSLKAVPFRSALDAERHADQAGRSPVRPPRSRAEARPPH